ncbi:MAG: diguanylate cyclase domain-containing protein, partial [Marinobacter adhaerens]|uniref:diguanylate cyclase domain-containing protein n=2 Tax=Marinobacter TaxID=2742 RepID=UPI003C4A65F8
QKRHREAEDRVNRLARYDQLTGLPSRETFMELLQADLEEAERRRSLVSLVVCGIDDFKSVNEQCGFRTGDLLLQTVADRLTQRLGGNRFTLARLGSDQFAIVEKGLRDGFQAADTADQILACVSQPMVFDDQTVSMTATLGIAMFPGDASKPDRLLQSAEQTMALAKQ